MSWSVSCVGKPANVVAHLKAESGKLTGQSKEEYDAALPHMIALVEMNSADETAGYQVSLVEVDANGSKAVKDGKAVSGNCSVTIRPIYKKLV